MVEGLIWGRWSISYFLCWYFEHPFFYKMSVWIATKQWLNKVDFGHLQLLLLKQMLSNLSWAEKGKHLMVFYGCEVVDSLKNAPLVGSLDTPSWTASQRTCSKIKPITARTSAETTILQDPKRYINISRCWQVCQKTHNIVAKDAR